jgi:seryl-tRNA synthetase
MELPVGKLNSELQRNLLYALERKFPNIRFDLMNVESASECLLVAPDIHDEQSQTEVDSFIKLFRKEAGSLGERVTSSVLWTHPGQPLRPLPLDQIEKASASKTDLPGVFMLESPMTLILESFDRIFCEFARSVGAEFVQIPSLLTETHLQKAGYWDRDNQQISTIVQRVSPSEERPCLSPAACLPLYPVLGRTGLKNRSVFSSRCGVFRWEGGVFPHQQDPLSRLWEYHVREIVFFGSEPDLQNARSKYVMFLKWLGTRLNLCCEVSTASDTFFHPESVNLAIYQLIHESKLEFRILFEKSALAISSFNFHGKHFTHSFHIEPGREELNSACIGFGLERISYAFAAAMETDSSCRMENLASLVDDSPRYLWLH